MNHIIKCCACFLVLLVTKTMLYAQPNIIRIEYYLDIDPGYGNATPISISPSTNFNEIALNINPNTLSGGIHILGIRAKDANGAWSHNNKWLFAKPYASDSVSATASNLNRVEYYIDADPGYGAGIPLAIPNGANISNVLLSVNISGLSAASHTLFIRSQNMNGSWSLDNKYTFTVSAVSATPSVVVNSISKKTLCAGTNFKVGYDAKGVFNAGNIFSAQLSDASGSFASPVVIGQVNAVNSGVINCLLPESIIAGSLYRVRILSSNPSLTSPASADTLVINAKPAKPTIALSGAATFCQGDSVVLSSSGASGYAWNTGATTQSITVKSAGSYAVTVNNAGGCTNSSDTVVVTVNSLPVTPTITASGPISFCEGGSVTLTSSTAPSYLWSTGATTKSIVVTTSGNYTVTTINASGCKAISAVKAVTVKAAPAIPVISASGSLSFCQGGSVVLTSTSAKSYLWTNGDTTRSTVITSGGSYKVTVGNATGCTATSTVTTVTVLPPPNATITPSGATTFCQGGSVTLTSSAASSYLWSTGATTQSIVVSTSGNYSVTVTNASGCSATSATAVVTVNAVPATPTISASGSTMLVCPGKTVTLTSSGGTTYLWSTGATSQSIVVATAGSYTVKVTNAAGCQSASSAATVVTYNVCAKPTGLVTSNITATAAKLSWTAVTCAVGYQYEYRVKGTIPYTVGQVTGINKTITGLAAGTTYQWRVVTACKINPDTITSNGYTNGPEFTTLSAAFAGNDGGGVLDAKLEKGLAASVMPNPARSIATVKVSNATGVVYIKLTDLTGKLIWQSKATQQNSFDIDVSRLAQGTYMVMVRDERRAVTLKMVKD